MLTIPFNKPHLIGKEIEYIIKASQSGKLSGGGTFGRRCQELLEKETKTKKALLTQSCTAALEMAAILIDTKPGDEIIMPSYTFVSTANAFVLRGGVPVFVDVRIDTLNIDETKIASAITPQTKAIVPVHYAGVSCAMDKILEIAEDHHLFVVEDAAQGVLSNYHGRALGTIGHLGALSFHDTKNVLSGEGGALLINDDGFIERAEIIREKGTDRSKFLKGQVDKYTWVDIGSSFIPSEIMAAFLLAQLEESEKTMARRLAIWQQYHSAFADLEKKELVKRPVIPQGLQHNAHIYYLLLPRHVDKKVFADTLKEVGVGISFHYVPLHSSPAGQKFAKTSGRLTVTNEVDARLVRLPLYPDLKDEEVNYVIEQVTKALA